MTVKSHETQFVNALKRAIRRAIIDAVKQGTCGMSANCLYQCTTPPASTLDGAPRGTNAAHDYRALFERITDEERDIKSFLI